MRIPHSLLSLILVGSIQARLVLSTQHHTHNSSSPHNKDPHTHPSGLEEDHSFDPLAAVAAAGLLAVFGTDDPAFEANSARRSVDDQTWISSSTSWIDRTSCRWLGLCGVLHLNPSGWADVDPRAGLKDLKDLKQDGSFSSFDDLKVEVQRNKYDNPQGNGTTPMTDIPSYVLEYAPLVYLHPEETYWPGHIEEHLEHTIPLVNQSLVPPEFRHPTLNDLSLLNLWNESTYLHSLDNVEELPEWLLGRHNIPVPIEDTDEERSPQPKNDPETDAGFIFRQQTGQNGHHHNERPFLSPPQPNEQASKPRPGRSNAPVNLVVVAKEDGVVDAFWWYFYSYNLGNSVFGIPFGNHIGDWEHMIVRFRHGKPEAVFFSQHSDGKAYRYDAVEKIGKRPVGYIATGTHAMYATAGIQPYILPFRLLFDRTAKGPLWDPSLNMIAMTYDPPTQYARVIRTKHSSPIISTSWFHFNGLWGDQTYGLDDKRQYRMAAQYHFISGPPGPKRHHLDRIGICQKPGICAYRASVYE